MSSSPPIPPNPGTTALGSKTVNFKECLLLSPFLFDSNNPSPAARELNKKLVDLRSLVKELNIYESLVDPVLTADITFQDDVNLSTIVPLMGLEDISIKFEIPNVTNPSQPRTYQFTFRVFKQSNREPINWGAENYTLGLVSSELLGSLEKRISKTYTNVKVENIIQTILTDYLESPKASTAFFEPTNSPVTITIPYLTPLDAINLFTLQGIGQTGASYFFYETLTGFRFESLRGIIKREKAKTNIPLIFRKLGGTGLPRDPENVASLEAIKMIHGFDFLESLKNGYFASTTIGVDVLAGQYRLTSSNLQSNGFDTKDRLNSNSKPFYPKELSRLANPTTKIYLIPTRSISAANTGITSRDSSISDNFFADTLAARVREITELQNCVVRVKVPGAPNINVGKVVKIEIPIANVRDAAPGTNKDIHSGKFLIVAAKHTIINNGQGQFEYETTFEACSDSLV